MFDIDSVMKKELVDVGQGVKMTEPIKVERGLITGNLIYASLSHQGILAICVNENTLQFTDLNTNKQVGITVESYSLLGLYDDMMLLLTWYNSLRETTVEKVFNSPNIEIFEKIEGTDNVTL